MTAYLSIDTVGMPVEFLTTEAATPSPFTRILYGSALPLHAQEKAVGALLKEVKQLPNCVFVCEPNLLRPNPSCDIDIVLMQDAGAASSQPGLQTLEVTAGGRRCQLSTKMAQALEKAKRLLEGVTWDPLEPFERLRSAQRELDSKGP